MLGSSAQIDAALKAAGEPVTFGAQACFGLLDRTPINELDDSALRVIGERITLTIRQDALNNLANDADIVVAGLNFTIRDIGQPQADSLRVLTLVEDV